MPDREVRSHMINGLNEALTIEVRDEPGAGGANHLYCISWEDGVPQSPVKYTYVRFQNGPIAEVGVNGVSNEALLAIVADRLECFQAGAWACEENALALSSINRAMLALESRTRCRIQRGVEGTSAV